MYFDFFYSTRVSFGNADEVNDQQSKQHCVHLHATPTQLHVLTVLGITAKIYLNVYIGMLI